MRIIKTIFVKQLIDTFRNPMVLVQFLIFPVVALIMTELVAKPEEEIPNTMFVTMMSAIFAGMALITSAAGMIAGDIEQKSLRFLVMAGVKPHQYLLGTGGFMILAGLIATVVFGLIGGFSGAEFAKFAAVMGLSVAASVILGATVGLLSKNQQAAMGLAMPLAVVLGFAPMIANFDENVEKAASVLYSQQLNVIVNDFSENFTKALLVIGANIAVLLILFAIVYRKKGVKF